MHLHPPEIVMTGPPKQSGRALARAALRFAVGFLLLCTLLQIAYVRFPFVQSGATLVWHMKHELARRGAPFTGNAIRVMAFGDSRTLSGFIPAVFDAQVRGSVAGVAVESYNFGLPADVAFVDDLEVMIARGAGPQLVLLTEPWPASDTNGATVFHFIDRDGELMDAAFPFRGLPRELMAMFALSRGSLRRMADRYRGNRVALQRVEADRGYHNIAEQHREFPGALVPPSLVVSTDTPDSVAVRRIVRNRTYERLSALFAEHGITCLFVPTYYREHRFAPAPPTNSLSTNALGTGGRISQVGPDYLLYPNDHFADLKHLNPRGADRYTRDLAALVAGVIAGGGGSAAPASAR